MTKQIIETGSSANDGTGDTLRTGAQKINANFTELYNSIYSLPAAGVGIEGTLGGVKVDGTSVVINNGVISSTIAGSVVGPASATDNAITRFNATTGKLLQNSVVTISDLGAIVAPIASSIIPFHYDNQSAFPSAVTYHGAIAHSHADVKMYFAHGGVWLALANASDVPAAQVQSDWNAISGLGVVLNKPTITTIPTQTSNSGKYLTTDGSALSWATVTGGATDYNDLTNKPTIPAAQIPSDWTQASNVALDYIKNKPTIPAAQVQSDWNAISGLGVVLNKPTLFDGAYSSLSGQPTLFSGSYDDLTSKPTIPAAYSATSINALSDVDTATSVPTAGQPLVWNAVSSSWVPGSVISGSLSILSDVTITLPAVGQVLKYNGSRWENDVDAVSGGAGVGTVTNVSVASANGFSGTVATSSSTPDITIGTSITGVLRGTGTAITAATSGTDFAPGTSALTTGIVKSTTTTGALSIAVAGTDYQAPVSATGILKSSGVSGNVSAAVAGTDYQAPIGTISGLVKGNGANALTAAVAGTDYQAAQSVTGIVKSSGTTRSAAVAGTDYQAPVSATGILKSSGVSGNVSAAVAGTDYQAAQSVTGIVKSSGTTRSAAVAGTDYQAPVSATGILKSSGVSGNVSAAVAGTDYQAAQSVTGIVKSSGTTRSAAVAGTDYQAAQSVTGIVKSSGTTRSAATSGTDYAPGTSALTTGIVKSTTTTGALSIAVAGTDYQAAQSVTGIVKSSGTTRSAAVAGTDYQAAQSVTGIVKSSGTTRSAATSGTDYAPGTSALTTGIVKSTTTTGALSIAVSGTDYQAPIGTISGIVKGNGANALTAATAGTDYQAPVSATGLLKSSGVSGNVSAAVAGTDYQVPITFTTTGSSGAATFNGTALNIPQYSGGGATAFSGLSDATSASLTVDKIYLPAITMLVVTANGSSAYRFDQYGTTDDPTIYAISGTTIAFDLGTGVLSSHPFLIRTSGGTNYDTGLTHVTSTGVVTTGSSAQGKTSGTLYWKIPANTTGNYQYICSAHGLMVGVITIKDISVI
jgi:hypothetical protein